MIIVRVASGNCVLLSIAVESWEHSEKCMYVEAILRTKIHFKHLKSEFMKSTSIWKVSEKPHGIKSTTKNHLHFHLKPSGFPIQNEKHEKATLRRRNHRLKNKSHMLCLKNYMYMQYNSFICSQMSRAERNKTNQQNIRNTQKTILICLQFSIFIYFDYSSFYFHRIFVCRFRPFIWCSTFVAKEHFWTRVYYNIIIYWSE